MYVVATCFYAPQHAQKDHKLQQCGVFFAPLSCVETKTSFLSGYSARHSVGYSWHGRVNHPCQRKRIVPVGDLLLQSRYKPGTACTKHFYNKFFFLNCQICRRLNPGRQCQNREPYLKATGAKWRALFRSSSSE